MPTVRQCPIDVAGGRRCWLVREQNRVPMRSSYRAEMRTSVRLPARNAKDLWRIAAVIGGRERGEGMIEAALSRSG